MSVTFATIVAEARRDSGLTAAEFDYQLNQGAALGFRAYDALGNAIYRIANAGQPEIVEGTPMSVLGERLARADALRERYADEIDQMIARAKAKSYTGWSNASRGPIRYAR
jgi:hypothetical protein